MTALVLDRSTVEPGARPEIAESPTGTIRRAEMPQFVVRTGTVYLVSGAATPARVLQWFADESDTDLDVVTLDFGTVELVGQVAPDGEPEDVRYCLTDQGRVALAEARREKLARLVGPFDRTQSIAAVSARS